jgi:uncharacterized membrane protein YsdA (DUF1294 family)
VWGIDKWKAILKKRRISENTLLIFCALGGFIGAILAMESFRHKTVKARFLLWYYLIIGVWIVVGIGLLMIL